MKPKLSAVMDYVLAMGEFNLPGFPTGDAGKAMVTKFLFDLVNTREELDWLCKSAFPKMRRFSMPELRGIFCTRYRPADGEEGYATETPGFTVADMEQRAKEIEAADTARKLAAWKREALIEGAAPQPAISASARLDSRDREQVRKQLLIPDGAFEIPRKPPTQAEPPKKSIQELEAELKEQVEKNRRSEEETKRRIEELKNKLKVQ